MNSTWVTKELFQSKSGQGTSIDTAKCKTEKREQEKKNSDRICEDCAGYCFDFRTNDDWIQCMECKVCFYERCDHERFVNKGLFV
jgi:hypothetical protein